MSFHCPGCDEIHTVHVGQGSGPRWGYNGNPERPTFTPSILTRFTKITENGEQQYRDYIDGKIPAQTLDHIDMVCHSFVTDGRIQFLGDCTHVLAGKTVDLPPHFKDDE